MKKSKNIFLISILIVVLLCLGAFGASKLGLANIINNKKKVSAFDAAKYFYDNPEADSAYDEETGISYTYTGGDFISSTGTFDEPIKEIYIDVKSIGVVIEPLGDKTSWFSAKTVKNDRIRYGYKDGVLVIQAEMDTNANKQAHISIYQPKGARIKVVEIKNKDGVFIKDTEIDKLKIDTECQYFDFDNVIASETELNIKNCEYVDIENSNLESCKGLFEESYVKFADTISKKLDVKATGEKFELRDCRIDNFTGDLDSDKCIIYDNEFTSAKIHDFDDEIKYKYSGQTKYDISFKTKRGKINGEYNVVTGGEVTVEGDKDHHIEIETDAGHIKY